jgi:hypothetical protein
LKSSRHDSFKKEEDESKEDNSDEDQVQADDNEEIVGGIR